jgi:hypothetical protein
MIVTWLSSSRRTLTLSRWSCRLWRNRVRNCRGRPGRLRWPVRLNSRPFLGDTRLVSKRDEFEATAFLLQLDVLANRPQIIIESCGMFRSNAANLVYDRIVHGITFLSSSGVQMIGTLYPLLAHTASITGRIIALAMCRQFHVKRKGIFC